MQFAKFLKSLFTGGDYEEGYVRGRIALIREMQDAPIEEGRTAIRCMGFDGEGEVYLNGYHWPEAAGPNEVVVKIFLGKMGVK